MLWIRVLFVLLAAAGMCDASITAAWKIPVEKVAPSFADAPPLAKPPGDSAFFQAGDKLWDLSKLLYWRVLEDSNHGGEDDPFALPKTEEVKVDWKGEWIVWNSRSGMIVARGAWYDILIAEHTLGCEEVPEVIRTRIEVKEAGKPRVLSLISRSGEKAAMEMSGLQAEVATTSYRDGRIMDCGFFVSWPASGDRGRWEVRTAVFLQDGRPRRIACQGTGDERWELVVSSESELLDGTPSEEFCWVETADGLEPRPNSVVQGKPLRKQLAADRWLGAYPAAGLISNLSSAGHVQGIAADLRPPAEFAEWIRSPLIDLRPWVKEQGVSFPDDRCFAGFDPGISTVFVVTDQINQDRAKGLFTGVLDGGYVPPTWIETNPESGAWGLASRSGEVAEIHRASGNLAENLLFRSGVTIWGNDAIFDFSYSLDVVASGAKIGNLVATTTLTKDKPQVIGSGTGSDGKEVKVVVTGSTRDQ